jgi:malonate-semialdehyde dehydrogenase (acetylating) / methylmalonate-semialdehyde dehydrogenase
MALQIGQADQTTRVAPRRIGHWIGGAADSAPAERRGDVYNPATGAVTGQVDMATAADVDRAVRAADDAFRSWAETSLVRRARVLFAFRELVDRHLGDIAALITAEHGKVLADARGEVARGLEVVDFACGIPHLLKGGFSENVSTAVDAYSIHQPLGVVAGVTPFNFPAMVPMWMFPVAIACGNTFILKPSEKDPSASQLLAELWAEAGLPSGVFNVVHGDKVAVDALLQHAGIAAVSFVGSTPVARYVYEQATQHGKRVQALGGAKNHAVVLPDADLDAAADALVGAAFGSAGERCMAISAVVAVGAAGDGLVERIAQRARDLAVGAGTEEGSEMGPLVTRAHRDRVASYVDAGVTSGATLVLDGRTGALPAGDGFWLGPTLFDNVDPEMSIYRDEIFGPVLSILRADTFEEALAVVNRNPYGNGTAIFTTDGRAARRFQHEVTVGMVGINIPIPVPMAFYSFGGWKDSLFGDSHVHGVHGVHFYTRTKAVTSSWPAPGPGSRDYGFPVNQ